MSRRNLLVSCLMLGLVGGGLTAACGAASKGGSDFTGRDGPTDPVVPVATPQDETCATALEGPFEDSLPVPADIVVEEDDNSVRLQWDGDLERESTEEEAAVEGYRVCWGPSKDKLQHAALFNVRIGNLFNVPNGEAQVGVIQSVDQRGRISAPSATFKFKGDPSRVDKLAAEMTGFFDDFNTKLSVLDELRWNVAFSRCNDPTASHMYVGNEFHALGFLGNHSYLPGSEEGCDRDQNIARARGVFDFTGRTGRIVLDFDGTTGNRSTWYLDVFPYESDADLVDITSHVSFDAGPGHPGRFLRVSQSGDTLVIHQYSKTGDPIRSVEGEIFFRAPEAKLLPGQVMRHWEFKIAKNYAGIYIDGELVLENTELDLDFEVGTVHFAQFGYNPIKVGYPWHTVHWDNFGFDGPATNVVVHNYKTSFNRDDLTWISFETDNEAKWEVPIPDSLEGATGARFFYTVQTPNYEWNKNDKVTINGSDSFPMPEPRSPAGAWDDDITTLGNEYPSYSASIAIPPEILKKGTNVVEYSALYTRVLNQHIEVYFEKGNEPKYTPPSEYVEKSLPEIPPFGPTVWLNMVNGNVCEAEGTSMALEFVEVDEDDNFEKWIELNTPLSGEVTLGVVVENHRPIHMFGKNLGIVEVRLIVDGEIIASVNTAERAAAPGIYDGPDDNNQPHKGGIEISFDTTKLANGTHELEIHAFDSAGTPARMGYLNSAHFLGVEPNDWAPLRFIVAN